MFDGVGAIWQSLTSLPFTVGGASFETDANCLKVLTKRCPAVAHLGDVRNIDLSDLVTLICDFAPDVILLTRG